MKPIQVMFDEELLGRLDASDEVRHEGRSAVLRRAAEEFLRRREKALIRERYAHAYGDETPLDGLEGWEEQGSWPDR